jgi:dihydrofolate reductase
MRRIHMFNRVSADGYFAAADGNLDWAIQDEALDKAATSGMDDTGAMIFGRRTYEGFKHFWPQALDDSPTSPAPHGPPRRSPELKAMAVWIKHATKYVFSRTLTDRSWQGTELLGDFDPKKVEAIKASAGKDIMIFGSGSIVSLLTEHGLIDDYTFVISPVLLGGGKLAIRDVSHRLALKLADVKEFPTGNVRLHYTKA